MRLLVSMFLDSSLFGLNLVLMPEQSALPGRTANRDSQLLAVCTGEESQSYQNAILISGSR